MITPPIYVPGDEEYGGYTRKWETSTLTTLKSQEYWTKYDQFPVVLSDKESEDKLKVERLEKAKIKKEDIKMKYLEKNVRSEMEN